MVNSLSLKAMMISHLRRSAGEVQFPLRLLLSRRSTVRVASRVASRAVPWRWRMRRPSTIFFALFICGGHRLWISRGDRVLECVRVFVCGGVCVCVHVFACALCWATQNMFSRLTPVGQPPAPPPPEAPTTSIANSPAQRVGDDMTARFSFFMLHCGVHRHIRFFLMRHCGFHRHIQTMQFGPAQLSKISA